ncbi:MAG: glycosyltransferase [Legionella sp.]|uniref:glycosyltransferase n=1 Tax=Legionella sp. TaxID=459 RepID=UPI00284FF748|nr:glycosyltransferase [Legionella sp.]
MTLAPQQKSKIAILLAVYNGMQYIGEQLQSLLRQSNLDVTIFVSIDLSSDNSLTWFQELASHDSRIVVLPYGERYGGAAKNFFRLIRDVNFSAFDYIAFSDQDDLWHLDKLSKATSILRDSEYSAYSSNVTAFWPDGREMLINKAQPQKKWDFIFEAAGPGCTYVMSNSLMNVIKANLLENWDIAQQISLHDWYCYAFARANDYQWYIDPEPSMLYRQHEKNQVGVNVGAKAYIVRLKQIKSGWWLHQAYLVAKLVGVSHCSFVQSWSKLGRISLLRLAVSAFQCRRRLGDQISFALICVGLAIIGEYKKIKPEGNAT